VQSRIKQMIRQHIMHNSHKDMVGFLEFSLIFIRDISLGQAIFRPENFHGHKPISDLNRPPLKECNVRPMHNSHKDMVGFLEFSLIFIRDISLGQAIFRPENFHGRKPISDLNRPPLKECNVPPLRDRTRLHLAAFLGYRLPSQTHTSLFYALCPHLCTPGKDFPVGHPSWNCSRPSTLNLRVLW
jgi:hypothetical protein